MLNKYVHSTLLRRKNTKLEIMCTVYFYLKIKGESKEEKAFSGITGYLGYFHFSVSFYYFNGCFAFYYFWLTYSIKFYYGCVRVCVCCVYEHMPHVSHVCELMCMYVHAAAHMAVRRRLSKPALCFQHVGPGVTLKLPGSTAETLLIIT